MYLTTAVCAFRQTATQMDINRSAQSACVLKGLPNIKGYSFHASEVENAPCSLMDRNSVKESQSNENEFTERSNEITNDGDFEDWENNIQMF